MNYNRLFYLLSLIAFQLVMYFSLLIAFDHLYLMHQEGVSTASVCGAVISLLFAVGSMMIMTRHKAGLNLLHTASSIMMKLMIAACLGGAVNATAELKSGGSHEEVWLKVSTLLLMALSVRLLLWRKSMGLFALYASAAVCVVMRSMIQGESVGEAVLKSVWLCASTLFFTYLSIVSVKEPDTSPK